MNGNFFNYYGKFVTKPNLYFCCLVDVVFLIKAN